MLSSIFAAALAALNCDLDRFRLFTTPQGAQTNGTIAAKDVPGALPYTNSSHRLNAGVCAASYGLREAQVMRKIFPLACGTIAKWGDLQDAMPDLTAFDLCPTNVPSDTGNFDPDYRYMVTAGGERAISRMEAGRGSVLNENGAPDLSTPPASNRVFRTPRITSYLKAVIDMPINALLESNWRKMWNCSPAGSYGCWLDPTVDHASLATETWCVDSDVGLVSDYATFLRSLSEYRNDANATNMTAGCGMFGGNKAWKWVLPWYESSFPEYGFPCASNEFANAKSKRESGKITDMIAKAAPGLRASVTGDWQKAVQKMAQSETTRLWWERQALANGIVALQSCLFMPLGCGFFGLRPTDIVYDSYLTDRRLSNLRGKDRYISGSANKSEYYTVPTEAITPYWGWFAGGRQKGLMAVIDSSQLNVTNLVITDNTTIEPLDTLGDYKHEAYWEQTGRQLSAGIWVSRDICGEDDRRYCLPNAGEEEGGGAGPAVIVFESLEPGEESVWHFDMFDLVVEAVSTVGPDGNESKEWVFSVYTSQSLPEALANRYVQKFNVPCDKWTGHGTASLVADVYGQTYESSDPPESWLPLPQAEIPYGKTSDPIGLVKEGSPLAEMMTADMLVLECARAGTNNYSGSWNFIDRATNDLKNAWIYTRLSVPYRNVVPTTGALKDLEHWAMGATPVKKRMGEVIDMLPDSAADKDPFAIEKARELEPGSLKPEVEDLFPKNRELAGPRETRLEWSDSMAWCYVLKRSIDGGYSAEWRVQNAASTLITIECGGTESVAKPTRHSVWVEYSTDQAMILNFDFPMMNFDADPKEAK